MGIITEQTKQRLTELERQINRLDFDIDREKQRNYTYLTVEEIERFLKSKVFDNANDIKARKLIVNTLIKEILLYEDEIIITYYFSDNQERIEFTPEHFEDIKNSQGSKLLWLLNTPTVRIYSLLGNQKGRAKPVLLCLKKDLKSSRERSEALAQAEREK